LTKLFLWEILLNNFSQNSAFKSFYLITRLGDFCIVIFFIRREAGPCVCTK